MREGDEEVEHISGEEEEEEEEGNQGLDQKAS